MRKIDYQKRQKRTQNLSKKTEDQLKKISYYRLFSFSLFIVAFCFWYIYFPKVAYFLIPVFFLLAFFAFIWIFAKKKRYLKRLKRSQVFYKKEIARQELKFDKTYSSFPKNLENHPFARDLHIVGDYSLFQLLNTCFCRESEKLLLKNLLRDLDDTVDDVRFRQKKIRSIAQKPIFVLKYLRLLQEDVFQKNFKKINLSWKEVKITEFWAKKTFLRRFFKIINIVTFLAILSNLIFQTPLAATLLFLQTLLFLSYRRKSIQTLKTIMLLSDNIQRLKKLCLYLQTSNFIKNHFEKKALGDAFSKLEKISNYSNFTVIGTVHFFLNALFLFDLWVLSLFEDFQKKYSHQMQNLLSELILFDSLLPFANFKIQNSSLDFPEISEDISEISAQELFHPLIHSKNRVSNILNSVNEKDVVLITGSNMAGKTTYLRTVGINLLLALCGSAVCGRNLKMPFLKIYCSISNFDSLEEGLSFFYAEVKRISFILKTLKSQANEKSLVLLDEVLKGTNSRERNIATRFLIKQLKQNPCFSFISSHDTELGKENVQNYHFTELVENGKMTFDYKIKNGLIQTTNALKVLELEGIFVNESSE